MLDVSRLLICSCNQVRRSISAEYLLQASLRRVVPTIRGQLEL